MDSGVFLSTRAPVSTSFQKGVCLSVRSGAWQWHRRPLAAQGALGALVSSAPSAGRGWPGPAGATRAWQWPRETRSRGPSPSPLGKPHLATQGPGGLNPLGQDPVRTGRPSPPGPFPRRGRGLCSKGEGVSAASSPPHPPAPSVAPTACSFSRPLPPEPAGVPCPVPRCSLSQPRPPSLRGAACMDRNPCWPSALAEFLRQS